MGCALVLGGGTVFVLCAPRTRGDNFDLRPDAVEYAVIANRVAEGDRATLPMGDREYPSRYPIGFPLLLAPAARAGLPPHRLWCVTAALAVLGACFTYFVALRLSGFWPGVWAGLFVVLAPLYSEYGLMIMSDVPLAAIVSGWLALLARGSGMATIGLVSGAAASVRLAGIVLLILAAGVAVTRGLRATLALAAGASVGLIPLALFLLRSHNGLIGGYGFWDPWHYGGAGAGFSFDAFAGNVVAYAPYLLGSHPHLYPVPVVALAVIGLATRRSRREGTVRAAAALALAYAAMAVLYFFRDPRLLVPVVPAVVVLAACGLEWCASRWRWGTTLLAAGLVGVQLVNALRNLPVSSGPAPAGPTLAAVAAVLPPGVPVVSDVPAPMAWLYWGKGQDRVLVPAAIPPPSATGNFVDVHLRRLARLQARGDVAVLPATAIGMTPICGDEDHVADRSPLRDGAFAVVLCTSFGRREIASALVGRLDVTDIAAIDECVVSRARCKGVTEE